VMFGDNDNDRQILQACGHPISMETAVPSICKLFPTHANTVNEAIKDLLDIKKL
jgi:haloacid dehalogenase-like hydrolase